ncbi:MAG: thioredoxin family protein [Hydrocarboniphaga sp.]|uniref:thioredoxin family protein n=1 Tax=Hydrocarboniphaga sp. TaxID=2033016 RepID=UPI0026217A9B|nr:thioredoxin family protein [Hydrocarboniphaga sp.]MDB5970921.1 thioredoxin family protein [Hydrocarboniphaga sp.]
MRPIQILGASAAMVAALLVNQAYAAAQVGALAPDFQVAGADGQTHSLSDYRGRFVVLEWTNAECPFVRKHYSSGNMQSLQQEAARDGTVWLTIISSAPGQQGYVDAAEALRLTEKRKALPTAVLLDEQGTAGHLYDAKTTPQMFVIDPKGTLIYAGAIDSTPGTDPTDIATSKNYVKLALSEARAGKPVTEAVTKPYGCSVKY